MREKLILIGGGGHCKSCIDVVLAEGRFEIAGIVESTACQVSGFGSQVLGYPVIGTDDDLPELVKAYKNVLITVGQIHTAEVRIKLFNQISKLGGISPVIISPNAYVSRTATIGAGTIVMHQVIVNTEAVIGVNCILNTGMLVEHETIVGDHCHLSTCSVINGQCRIGSRVFIGSRTVLSNNINIVDESIISAGSVVFHSIREAGVYSGNPLQRVR